MNISQMHVWFRQYAQQMGLQNVRAILPEQIDLLINTSISDTVNDIIRQSVAMTNDRTPNDSSKIGQINALRTLYKTADLSFDENLVEDTESAGGRWTTDVFCDGEDAVLAMLYLIDLSIRYKKSSDEKSTNYFPVRIIDDVYLADTLNDFILKPRVRTPIAVMTNKQLEIYLGDEYDKGNGLLTTTTLIPYQLRVSYLAKPAVVKYTYDVGEENVDCDLPEALHVDILKHAVDLYRISVSGALNATQGRQQPQQQSDNGYRSDVNNNGY